MHLHVNMEPLQGTDGTVFTERGRLYTRSRSPGIRVYGERLVQSDGSEYREWSPRRSKLSAYLTVGGTSYPFNSESKVLYLGAANGTTVSHISDVASEGRVWAVEFSPRSFRDLVSMSGPRDNVMPILADATRPEEYAFALDHADIVYSDVAQKGQADILADNMDRYGASYGVLCLKARSEDVAAAPAKVYAEAERRLRERGMQILDSRAIDPHEKDHAVIVVRRPRTVYAVAFAQDGRFLMVYHPRRKGWEMPGGKTEAGETPERAAVREFAEESGCSIEVVAVRDIGYCDVCAAKLTSDVKGGEMEHQLFSELPEELSFGRDEYEEVVPWARKAVFGDRS